jgi:pyruvate dehydrogenase E1 component alpha subunit
MPLEDIFKYMYADWTPQLREQYEAHKKFLEEAGK